MRTITLVATTLLALLAPRHARTQVDDSGAIADSVCPLLSVALAAAVDTAQPLRLVAQAEMPWTRFGEESRTSPTWTWIRDTGEPVSDSLVQRLASIPDGGRALPRCAAPARAHWHTAPPALDDTTMVTFSPPVLNPAGTHALVFVAWQRYTPSLSLNSGPVGSGRIYVLERREDGWKVVRSIGVWAIVTS